MMNSIWRLIDRPTTGLLAAIVSVWPIALSGCNPTDGSSLPVSVEPLEKPAPVNAPPRPGNSIGPSDPRTVPDPTIPEKAPVARKPGRVENKTFDDLKFDIEPGDDFRREMLPPRIEYLVGREIRIRGYILPTPQADGITQFVLVRDNLECCFGPGAALYDCIQIDMQPGSSARYTVLPISVRGIFSIQVEPGPDGRPIAIFHMLASEAR